MEILYFLCIYRSMQSGIKTAPWSMQSLGSGTAYLFVCEIVYLQFSLFLLQHFPEYLSGMFLYFWVLENTFTAKVANNFDAVQQEIQKYNNLHNLKLNIYFIQYWRGMIVVHKWVNIMSFTWSGLGPVILWDGVLLSPEGKGGGGEGGASPPRDVLWLGARSEGRGSKGKDAVEGGGPCNVRATYVPATGRLKKKKGDGIRKTQAKEPKHTKLRKQK